MRLNRRINYFLLDHLTALIDQFFTTKDKSDRLLRNYFRKYKIGKGDRAWLSDRFYMMMRHRYLFEFIAEDGDVSIAEAVAEFAAGRINPASDSRYNTLREEGRLVTLFHSYPQWIIKKIAQDNPDKTGDFIAWLNQKASVVVRANRKQMSRTLLLKELDKTDSFPVFQTPLSPDGLAIYGDTRRLSKSEFFEKGCFEFQDESSQLTAYLVSPTSKTLLDACAGGGGKSLAILNAFPKISLVASDIRTVLFPEITSRAERAGHHLKTVKPKALNGTFDTVFLDMPCSGSGVLRRNPEDRWRITPETVEKLTITQKDILATHAKNVSEGGEIIYITCSAFRDENEAVIEGFLEKNSAFELLSVADRLQESGIVAGEELCEGSYLKIKPGWDRDIFFGAILRKTNH
ncbi:RsmB/NOP family class I SAM-dependent RNA methyltransferase [bacterium]|nr:RsmB/NOP family class I SAM-dependent RNA methyltransferase [bacterium]